MLKNIFALVTLFGFIGCTEGQSIDLEGRIAMKGSAMLNYLTIYDKQTQKSYKIQNKEAFNLVNRQNQTIRIEAKIIKETMGPGYPAVIEVVNIK